MNNRLKAPSSPTPSGPENKKLPEFNAKRTPVIVSVFDANDKLVREERIDYSDFEHRKWLGRITFWAITEGLIVETRGE